jgi:WD40 repeat protein
MNRLTAPPSWNILKILVLAVLCMMLSGQAGYTVAEVPTVTQGGNVVPEPTITSTAAMTADNDPDSCATRQPASASTVSQARLEPITTQNANRLAQLVRMGRGINAAVAWSPDGKTIAVASSLGVWLYPADNPNAEPILLESASGTISVAFSHDGTRLASGSNDGTVRLWDVRTGKATFTLQGHTDAVWSVAFSPDGSRLDSASWDKTIRIWDTQTGKFVTTLQEHTAAVNSVAFSPDGTRLASGSEDQTVRIWDTKTNQSAAILKAPNGVVSVAFSPDGKLLASGSVRQ